MKEKIDIEFNGYKSSLKLKKNENKARWKPDGMYFKENSNKAKWKTAGMHFEENKNKARWKLMVCTLKKIRIKQDGN